MKTVYYTNLPHIQPIGDVFFVTFRLAGSLPKHVIAQLNAEYLVLKNKLKEAATYLQRKAVWDERKRYFARFDDFLDKNTEGNHWLKIPEIAKIVMDKLHEFDKNAYTLLAYVVMSNHVHVLFDFSKQLEDLPPDLEITEETYMPLYRVMQQLKGSTARQANLHLGKTGSFWQKDNYDHYVRNDTELNNIIWYILNNPVKAGLVNRWEDSPYKYASFL